MVWGSTVQNMKKWFLLRVLEPRHGATSCHDSDILAQPLVPGASSSRCLQQSISSRRRGKGLFLPQRGLKAGTPGTDPIITAALELRVLA